jgi:hypothetical protein
MLSSPVSFQISLYLPNLESEAVRRNNLPEWTESTIQDGMAIGKAGSKRDNQRSNRAIVAQWKQEVKWS